MHNNSDPGIELYEETLDLSWETTFNPRVLNMVLKARQ